MDVGKVGYHAGSPLDISIKRGYDVGVRVFQLFLGTPRRYTVPDSYIIRKLKEDFEGIEVVVHSPYWVSLGKSPSGVQWQRTLGYTVRMAEELDKAGVKYYVTHVGARDSDVISAMRSMVGFCQQWLWRTEGSKVILCLENDSGSKMGTKLGPVKILERVIREVNSDRVRMTFDCLDRREKIRTSDGFITVSELFSKYNKGEIVEVVSWDGKKEVIRPVSFVARRKVESGELVYHVDSVLGRVNCSEKHKFMTPKGIKLARELVGGDFVYSSEEGLDDLQKQILYGTLAGDTCLGFTKNRVRLQLQQGVKQEKYLDFKCKVFSNLRLTKKIKVVSKRKDGSDAVNFKVVSRCNESLREFERVCYKNGKRFFSREWADRITPLGLAMWFYDDGSLSKDVTKSGKIHRYAFLHVQKMSKEELDNLLYLMDKFSIEVRVGDYDKGYQLNFTRKGTDRLMELINPYLYTEDMAYKHINPVISECPAFSKVRGVVPVKVSTSLNTEKWMYDFTVEGTHLYYAHNYLVHNCEHAYANGMDLSNTDRLNEIKDLVSVVHWNSIPQNVIRGNHLDRHSSTKLLDCKEGFEYIRNVYNVFYDGVRPFILERGEVDFALNDRKSIEDL